MIDDKDEEAEPGDTGYRKPPRSTRYRPGQSGNPRGRPRGHQREAPYDAVLGQMVAVREAGAERRMMAAEAFLLFLTKRGLEGDGAAARAATRAFEELRDRSIIQEGAITSIAWQIVSPGSVNKALAALRMGKLLDPYHDTARMLLEPWIVEASLARLGDRQFSEVEQRIIVATTRTPHKVRWPAWWTVK